MSDVDIGLRIAALREKSSNAVEQLRGALASFQAARTEALREREDILRETGASYLDVSIALNLSDTPIEAFERAVAREKEIEEKVLRGPERYDDRRRMGALFMPQDAERGRDAEEHEAATRAMIEGDERWNRWSAESREINEKWRVEQAALRKGH